MSLAGKYAKIVDPPEVRRGCKYSSCSFRKRPDRLDHPLGRPATISSNFIFTFVASLAQYLPTLSQSLIPLPPACLLHLFPTTKEVVPAMNPPRFSGTKQPDTGRSRHGGVVTVNLHCFHLIQMARDRNCHLDQVLVVQVQDLSRLKARKYCRRAKSIRQMSRQTRRMATRTRGHCQKRSYWCSFVVLLNS